MNAVRKEKTTTEVCYMLERPTNAVEVSKAINWAAQECAEHQGRRSSELPDDAITVTTEDDLIVISWVKR